MNFSNKILLILLFLLPFKAQEQDAQFKYAERLFELGQYYDAITEYKRLLFFDASRKYLYSASLKISQSYKAGAKLNEAEDYALKAVKHSVVKEEKFESIVNLARVNMLQRNTKRAMELLNNLQSDYQFDDKLNEIYYWKGWAYIFADEWDKAAYEFAKTPDGAELRALCLQTDSEKISVTFAKVISYILPGSGQIYAGNYLSGLMSLAWNIVGGYFTINAAIDNRVFDAIIVGDLVWLRFYHGNLQNAEEFAKQKNINTVNKTLEYLQNNYRGLKP